MRELTQWMFGRAVHYLLTLDDVLGMGQPLRKRCATCNQRIRFWHPAYWLWEPDKWGHHRWCAPDWWAVSPLDYPCKENADAES